MQRYIKKGFIKGYMKKIKELQEYLRKKKIDYALIFNTKDYDYNFFYFTNFNVEFSYLLIPKKGSPELLTFDMEYERAKKESRVRKIKKFLRGKEIRKYLKKKLKNKIVGIAYENVSLGSAKRLKKYCKIRDISKILLEIRAVKTKDEIKKIRKSCSIASNILKKCIANFKRFKTELDVKKYLEEESRKKKCSFGFGIVASGSNASIPHYNARNIKLKKGFCVIDFGVIWKNYYSDLTRTLYIGKPSKREIEQYYKVLWLQEEAIKSLKPGIKAKKVDSYVRERLKNFIHGDAGLVFFFFFKQKTAYEMLM